MYLGVTTIRVIAQVVRGLCTTSFEINHQPTVATISSKMQWKALALALLVGHGSGQGMLEMMRFSCSKLVIDRLDPLVNPGLIPSPHLHQIVGGVSGFYLFINSSSQSRYRNREADRSRTHSTLPWTRRTTISPQTQHAPAALSRKTFPTTGLRSYTSELVMERTNACLNTRARVLRPTAASRCIISQPPMQTQRLPPLSPASVCSLEMPHYARQARRARYATAVCRRREITAT